MSVNLNVSPPSIEFKGELDLKDDVSSSKQVNIARVFHCDGLLLCTTKDNRLVLWNPCLGEARWIQLKDDDTKYSKFALGYQNNESCRSYKILRFRSSSDYENRVLGIEIYEFNSDSWRVLDYVAPDFSLQINGVSLKENTYWLPFNSHMSQSIFGFDFTTEIMIENLCLPSFQYSGEVVLSVVREDQLSVLHRSGTSKLEIWVTNKVVTEANPLHWSKSFVADLHTSPSLHLVFSSLLVDEEKKVALCCNLDIIYSCRNMVYIIGEDNEYLGQVPFIDSENDPFWLYHCLFENQKT